MVVLGEEAARLAPMVERPPLRPGWKARAVRNPRARDGKCASIHAGLAAMTVAPAGILIASVDQPLDWRLLNAMLRAAEEEWDRAEAAGRRRVIVPSFHGRPGHPPLFHASLISELMGIGEESQGLKAVVRRDPGRVLHLPWDDAGILMNLNTPLDLPWTEPRQGMR